MNITGFEFSVATKKPGGDPCNTATLDLRLAKRMLEAAWFRTHTVLQVLLVLHIYAPGFLVATLSYPWN